MSASTAPPAAGPRGGAPSLTTAPGRVRPLYVGVGAVGVGALAWYMKRRSAQKAAANQTPVTSTADTTVTDDFTQLQNEIGQLQTAEQNEPLPSNNPTPTPNPRPRPRPPIHGGRPPQGPIPPVIVPGPAPTPPPRPPSNPTPTPTPAQTHTYKVQHNDTLWGIAQRAGISLDELRRLNPVYWTNPKYQNGNRIWAGDSVVLPGPG